MHMKKLSQRISSEKKRDGKSRSKIERNDSLKNSMRSSIMEAVDIARILEMYNTLKGAFEAKELPSRQLHLRRFG